MRGRSRPSSSGTPVETTVRGVDSDGNVVEEMIGTKLKF